MEQSFRGYELLEKIGEGGFGAVYRAFQPVIEREVAIKVILPKYANQLDFIRNFEAEAQVVARLEHPYIVPLYDYWRDPHGAYLVMRWFPGNLRQFMTEKGVLSPHTVLWMLEQITAALHTAHRKQVIHRDLKPDNILLDEDSNAYLTDFGIARTAGQDPSTQSVSGTIAYTSPDQLQSQAPAPQMDVYSLGIMVYEMLAGKHPFAGLSPVEMVYHHMQHPIPDISETMPELPTELDAVLQQATAKDSATRYATVMNFLNTFRAVFVKDGVAVPLKPSDEPIANPYKGLRAFDVADAADFFGRENLVHTMIERLREGERFLAVVGSSGSGKSSAVKAGLIPALRSEVITDTDKWLIADMIPSVNPLHNLAEALASVSPVTLTNAEEQLASNEKGLIWLVDSILADTTGELVLVIDQFEEVFTLADEAQRNQFLTLLTTALIDENAHLRVVMTLRADFYDRPLMYDGFGQLVQDHTQVVLPLSPEELERAITSPAQRVGIEVERELVAAMVSDVREEPGALPLLQYTLTDLFERRENQTMTLVVYRDSGGVLGVLATRADDIYQTLSETQQTIARQVFLRLVTLGEGTEDTRRRVQRAELQQIIPNRTGLNAVLEAFGQARLLTFDVDSSTRQPLIEVAHEALIREWQQLREWLADSRNDVRLQRLLAIAAAEWREFNQDGSYLLRGSRLAQFEEWSRISSVILSPAEKTFLGKSIVEQEADFDARQRTQLERQRLQVQVQARQQQIIFGLFFGVVIALGLTIFAFFQANNAGNEANANATAQAVAVDARETSDANAEEAIAAQATSEHRAIYANAQQLALRAEQLGESGQESDGLALAVEANRLQNPPPDAIRILSDLSNYPLVQGYLDGHNEEALALAFTPDGQRLLSGACSNRRGSRCSSGELLLWDIASGEIIRRMEGHSSSVSTVDIAADSRLALSGSNDGSVILWDLETGEQLRVYEGQRSKAVFRVVFSPDGTRFGTILVTGAFILRETESSDEIEIAHLDNISDAVLSAAFSFDGTQLALGICLKVDDRDTSPAGCDSGEIIHMDALTGEIIARWTAFEGPVTNIAFSLDGQLLNAASGRDVGIWDVEMRQISQRFQLAIDRRTSESGFDVSQVVSADGQILTNLGPDGFVTQIDLQSGGIIRNIAPFQGFLSARRTAISLGGQRLAIALNDNRILLIEFNSPDQLYDWVLSRRTGLELSCEERITFGVEPRCDEGGNILATPTPFPTMTPFPTATIPVWTPIPSPTPISN